MSSGNISCMADIVRSHGTERPDHPCLIEGTQRLTWADLYGRAQRVANGFAAAGVGNQDRVAFLEIGRAHV